MVRRSAFSPFIVSRNLTFCSVDIGAEAKESCPFLAEPFSAAAPGARPWLGDCPTVGCSESVFSGTCAVGFGFAVSGACAVGAGFAFSGAWAVGAGFSFSVFAGSVDF